MLFLARNCKYFIGYIDDNYKIKPFSVILPKTSLYIKSYDGETKLTFRIKSAIVNTL